MHCVIHIFTNAGTVTADISRVTIFQGSLKKQNLLWWGVVSGWVHGVENPHSERKVSGEPRATVLRRVLVGWEGPRMRSSGGVSGSEKVEKGTPA